MRVWAVLSLIALLCGAALRTTQYVAQSSLWVDEAALARNIVSRPISTLADPLDFAQYAPIGFLAVQKALVALGTSELVLRAVPFASSLLALVLFAPLARRLLSAPAAAVATVMFSLGSAFVYFGSQAKQYSSDVAIALALLLFTARLVAERRLASGSLAIGVGGAVACLFSHPAILVVGALGAALAALWWLRQDAVSTPALLRVGGWWVAGVIVGAVIARRSVSDIDLSYAQQVWLAWFAPMPPTTIEEWLWPWQRLVDMFGVSPFAPPRLDGGLRYPLPSAYAALALAGFAGWWRRGARAAALLVGAPLLVALAASALRLYPLGGRVSLYLLPLPILAAAEGWDWACRALPPLRGLRLAAAALVLAAPVFAIARNLPPFHLEHLRPVLQEVRREWREGDHIYVYYGAGQAFLFYAPDLGFTPDDYTIGSCSRADPTIYTGEIAAHAGRTRLWTVVTHATGSGAEMTYLREYLDGFGRRQHAVEVPAEGAHAGAGAYAFLHDLSATRPVAVTPPAFIDMWPLACYGTMSPESATTGR